MESLGLLDLTLRLALAAGLGASIGAERELRDQSAGFRTHMLVSLGAALFTMTGAFGVESLTGGSPDTVRFDPTRIAAQVVTGIGFLGAGAIIRHGLTVRGLTTAAAMWVTAAIGTAVGLGYYAGAVITAIMSIVALFAFRILKTRFLVPLRRDVAGYDVRFDRSLDLTLLVDTVERKQAVLESLRVTTEDNTRHAFLLLRMPRGLPPQALVAELGSLDGVLDVGLAT
jgi:putative Mg2+ transporter-C (MgtC) family protein